MTRVGRKKANRGRSTLQSRQGPTIKAEVKKKPRGRPKGATKKGAPKSAGKTPENSSSNSKRFTCDECRAYFYSSQEIENHLVSLHGKKPESKPESKPKPKSKGVQLRNTKRVQSLLIKKEKTAADSPEPEDTAIDEQKNIEDDHKSDDTRKDDSDTAIVYLEKQYDNFDNNKTEQQQQQQQQWVQYSDSGINCSDCPLYFDNVDKLSTHYFIYHKTKYYLVAESNYDELFHFIIVRHNDIIKCPLCSCKGQNLSSLNEHMRKRHELSTWLVEEPLHNYDNVIVDREENRKELSFIYPPVTAMTIPKQRSYMWQTVKNFFWS